MRLIHNKGLATLYWVIGFLASVFGAVGGARWASGGAPKFGDGSGASASSHLLFGAGGAILGLLVVAALFSAVWMALWASDRRANPQADDRDDYDTLDDLDDDFDEAEREEEDDEATAEAVR